ncbi:type II toxin-antitoxin system RelE/ParE family toxin [Achromobacter sp. GD03932]|nr:type II toxin-antitoxin system RelE/ParE family toxin [Achromobacter sp. GD03932]MDH1299529.1 type II toxin-antitoxin system RelE/ParE family toxin [Achromobacter sp. GD03932]
MATPVWCWLAPYNALRARRPPPGRRQSGIQARIQRLAHGNPGDYRNLKKGVSELRIDIGPGYRVYYKEREDNTIVIVLVGGDKSKQQRHIDLAYELAEQL